MRFSGLLILICCFVINGLHAQTSSHNIEFDNMQRSYEQYLPAGYDGTVAMPLVFNLHGYGSNGLQELAYTAMNQVADTAGFIVIYPDGINNAWNAFSNFSPSTADDVGYISYLIDVIASQYHVDASRVYACGMSNGGFMSYRLACELDGRIAAVASVTGLTSTGLMLTCNSRPMPAMQIHGTMDATVPYNGGTGLGTVDSTVNFWLNKLNCPLTTTADTLPDISTTDNSRAVRYVYTPCDSNTQFVFYKILNGGHTWPGATINLSVTNQDFNASAAILSFFKQYTHPNASAIDTVVIPTGITAIETAAEVSVFPNPMQHELRVQAGGLQRIVLHDATGRVVAQQQVAAGSQVASLPTQGLQPGIYLLQVDTDAGSSVRRLVK